MSLLDFLRRREEPENSSNYVEMIDLVGLTGMYVTENPTGVAGIKMWCGYCCKPLHYDHRHMGTEPFLTLMVKMADAHRLTDCPDPKGPFVYSWSPHSSTEWHQWAEQRYRAEQPLQGGIT